MALLLCGLLFLLAFTSGCGAQKTESKTYYTSLSELEHKRIGVSTGSIQAIQAQERLPDAEFFYYNTQTDMLNALRADKIDAFAEADALLKYMISDNPDLTYLDEWLAGGMDACAIFPKT
ncbi:MAG: transporter substrate-binding domain-containing protein [Parasporobacterium sp.]|nr:transporter substrate-binding domain-containing protein [Parasporobacterium sp.]